MEHRPKFVIETSEAESMAKTQNLSVPQLLPTLVKSAQKLARPPISNYHVGAVGLGSDGRIFIGVNLEFPGLPLHQSVHAEQFLLTNLAVNGCRDLEFIAVSAEPCGHCRQFFQELRNVSKAQIIITDKLQENAGFQPLSSILPNPFGPFDLLDEETPLLLEKHNNGLSLIRPKSDDFDQNRVNLANGLCLIGTKGEEFDQDHENFANGVCELTVKDEVRLRNEALEGANGSHAPYSRCPSGVALMDSDGKIYRGSYVESAAYNPSLGPVQAALVAYIAAGGGGYENIVAAVLVEKEGAVVRQEDTARLLLKSISPKSRMAVILLQGIGWEDVQAGSRSN